MLGLRRKIFVLLVVTGLLLVLSGCGGGKQPAAENDKPAPIKVGMMPITDNLPFWLAEQKGYFRDEGIEVELVPFPSALERDSAFAAGKIDAGIGDMLAVAAMNNGGTVVKAVSVGQGAVPGENRFAILSAPDSSITSPEQLKNVPIALSLNTINEYITDNLLVAGGLKPEEIKKNNMVKLPIRFEALLNGNVQAATLPDPFATLAEIKGAHLVVDNTENTVAQTVVIVRRETLDANLAGVQKMMRAYARAVEDLQADPRQYDELIAEKARVPEEVLASQAHPLRLHFSAPRLPDKQGVEKTIAWMKDHGLLQKDFEYNDLVDGRVIGE
ncbi:ABC transporter substrate-binding protein [Desulfoscipio geothermicus]|uniref:NitT/TauT family transport system substrate-binding protein n=1 Tax=Desulfoscipio geothermicus DSM 3669 TaxID=1121426 RepID=A0A1I6CNZ0_9FIRM|nr:MetQ/NlpA family ABC transporter substrate-binding protein [Desulfoscipio geothermicus]SFQ94903.1 NitT/TauT family transport system substrate-binding protein [Desulfoscipio geothermicus DSM 3669]